VQAFKEAGLGRVFPVRRSSLEEASSYGIGGNSGMASSEDSESKVKRAIHIASPRGAWIKELHHDLGENFADFYNDDRVRIDYYKKNPPLFPDPSNGKYENPHRLTAAEELSLEICEMLNHLHISPSPDHVRQTFDNNQIAALRHMMRCMATHYTINNT
jgi:hypothetical protein